jgi:hypothetical protein
MPNEEWEELLQEVEEQIYSYNECEEKGHFWYKPEATWFRYGWRWPWRTRMFALKCAGCGWAQFSDDGRPSRRRRPWPRRRS